MGGHAYNTDVYDVEYKNSMLKRVSRKISREINALIVKIKKIVFELLNHLEDLQISWLRKK